MALLHLIFLLDDSYMLLAISYSQSVTCYMLHAICIILPESCYYLQKLDHFCCTSRNFLNGWCLKTEAIISIFIKQVNGNIKFSKFSNLKILVSFWDLTLMFSCDHDFKMFQNNFWQLRVSQHFFIHFVVWALSAHPPKKRIKPQNVLPFFKCKTWEG